MNEIAEGVTEVDEIVYEVHVMTRTSTHVCFSLYEGPKVRRSLYRNMTWLSYEAFDDFVKRLGAEVLE